MKLTFQQIKMLANFSDATAGYPKLMFEQAAKKLGVDFCKAKVWEKECREAFTNLRRAILWGRFGD
jgi:hypothetical protein